MPVLKYLDLSTAHVTAEDNALLADLTAPAPGDTTPFGVEDHAYGHFLQVPEVLLSETRKNEWGAARDEILGMGFSEAFARLLEHAGANGCSLINLDRDGDLEPDLESFEW